MALLVLASLPAYAQTKAPSLCWENKPKRSFPITVPITELGRISELRGKHRFFVAASTTGQLLCECQGLREKECFIFGFCFLSHI
jgi:hypothetical protein